MPIHWIVLLATLTAVATASASTTPEWEWVLTPYIWASDTSADLSLPSGSVEGGVDFEDLISKVDLGTQLHFEGSRDRIGFWVDITYLSIDEREYRQPTLPVDVQLRLNIGLDTLLAEVAGTYRVAGESQLNGFDLVLDIRVIDTDLKLDIDFAAPGNNALSGSASDTLTDVFVGGRYVHDFGYSWVISLRGDVGTGDTDLTWNTQAQLVYLFGQDNRFGAVVGYRYMNSEYESSLKGEQIDVELTMSGPALGFAFRF